MSNRASTASAQIRSTRTIRRSLASRAGPARRDRGFSLLELFLVLLSLALAGYIGATEIARFQHRAKRDQFVAELRGVAAAFEAYHAQKGEWPAATNAEARVPRGMEAALAATHWSAGTPFGGAFDWMPPPSMKVPDKDPAEKEAVDENAPKKPPPPGMIAITAFTPGPALSLTEDDLRYIDSKLDDGNLSTGRFRTGFNGWPFYVVEAKP